MKTILILMTAALMVPLHGDEEELKNRVALLARKVSMDGLQVTSMGVTGNVQVYKPVPNKSKNKGAPAWLWVKESNTEAVLRKAKDVKAGVHANVTAVPSGGAAYTETLITWSGKAWRIGWVQYVSIQGIVRKLPLFTASEEEALAFYRKHGFTNAARDAVRVEK